MAEHTYKRREAVEKYDESHGFDQTGLEKLQNEVIKKIKEYIKKENISLLDIGVGNGKWLFIPLLEEFIKSSEFSLSKVDVVDNSDEMINELRNQLQKIQNKLNINIYKFDIEKIVVEPRLFSNEKYDILILMAVLHHVINWRDVLSSVIERINKNGLLIISERDFASDILDGKFYGSLSDRYCQRSHVVYNRWKEIWEKYYRIRNRYVPWEQEISVSDYSWVLMFLLERKFELLGCYEGNWEVKYPVNSIKEWIEKSVFANFERFLDREERDDIKQQVLPLLNKYSSEDGINEFEITEGWRIWIFQKKEE